MSDESSEIGNIGLFFLPLSAYMLIVVLVTFGNISERLYQFHILAIVLGLISVYVIRGEKIGEGEEGKENLRTNYLKPILLLPLLLVLFLQVTPYVGNNIPLGYDPGIYKYEIERYWEGLPNAIPPDLENWDRGWSPPGLFILTNILHLYGFNQFDHYNAFFIFTYILITLSVYLVGKKMFSTEAGLIAAFFFAASLVQFRAFWLFYFKNMVAIFLTLVAVYLFESKKFAPVILMGAVIGAIHRPTFLIFGSILVLAFIRSLIPYPYPSFNKEKTIKIAITGSLILLLGIAFYIPAHMGALNPLKSVVESTTSTIESGIESDIASGGEGAGSNNRGMGGGTFISPEEYQYSSLFYLPFAITGALISLRRLNLNLILFWALVTAIIVYLKLFFFNRFIIHLDIALLLLAGAGFFYLIKYNRIFGAITLCVLGSTAVYSAYGIAEDSEPLIDNAELKGIMEIQKYDEDSYAMAVTSVYSPWVVGYSGKKTIAPGLFEYDKWNYAEWKRFWALSDSDAAAEMLKVYGKPIYIFVGKKEHYGESKFWGECFERVYYMSGAKIYRFGCV